MNLDRFQQLLPSKNTAVPSEASEAEELDVGRVLSALKRRMLLIASITLALAGAAGARALLSAPTYQASFEILIQPSSAENEAIASLQQASYAREQRSLSLKDKVKILTSPSVLAPVADKLAVQYPQLCAPNIVEGVNSNTPQARRTACYKTLVDKLKIQLTETDPTKEASRIFRTTYSGATEAEARAISGLIAETFLEYGLQARQRDILQGIEFLDQKLPEVRGEVRRLQNRLQTLRQDNDLITPDARSNQLSGQIANFRQEYLAVQVELEETTTVLQDLTSQQRPQDAVASPALSNSQRYQTLISELLALDSELAEASSLFLDSSPDIQSLRDQRQNLLALLFREREQAQRELVSQIQSLESRQQALADILSALNVGVDELATLARQFNDIELELSIATENLNRLLQRRDVLQLEAAQRELPWELITPPLVTPNAASIPMNVVLGLVLGLLLGIGVAIIVDTMRDQLYTPRDLKRITPLPILGLIPHQAALPDSLCTDQPALLFNNGAIANFDNHGDIHLEANHRRDDISCFRESFRSLVGNLRRISADPPIRLVVVSSAEAGEGKTTVALNMAEAAAAMGERVLLIDANLRLPCLHRYLNLSNQNGFTNLLAGSKRFREALQQSPTEANLYILTAGEKVADSSRLLTSKTVGQFCAKVKPDFDLIIFDTPSILNWADPILIANETDGMILVSHLGQIKSTQLESALERLWISKVSLLGIVAKEAPSQSMFQL